MAYFALSQSECRKKTVTILRDLQIISAHGLILIDKLGLLHIHVSQVTTDLYNLSHSLFIALGSLWGYF